jgi:sugar lactone lactonase YvrE
MRMWVQSWLSGAAAALLLVLIANGLAAAAAQAHYVIANDDSPSSNSVSFYTVESNGLLKLKRAVQTGGFGIGGGYFATNRLAVLDNSSEACVYASDAGTGDIVGINVSTLKVTDTVFGSAGDAGTSNGIGLALNAKYLYASFTDSNTIGTFQLQPGCLLTFVNDVAVAGLQGGVIDGMALHGNILVATYGDGSIESFNIAAGSPVSNGDEENTTAFTKSRGATYPNSVEITKDGRFAIFGDTSTSTVIEVAALGQGKLSQTHAHFLGDSHGSSNILLSPDETLLYVSNTQGDRVTALSFDKSNATITAGCASGPLKGYSVDWSYLAALALSTNAGTGGTLYVTEFGGPSSIAVVEITSTGGKCTLTEQSGSPIADPNSPGLLSIDSFPPRSF